MKIKHLKQQINSLNGKIHAQQTLLAQHAHKLCDCINCKSTLWCLLLPPSCFFLGLNLRLELKSFREMKTLAYNAVKIEFFSILKGLLIKTAQQAFLPVLAQQSNAQCENDLP